MAVLTWRPPHAHTHTHTHTYTYTHTHTLTYPPTPAHTYPPIYTHTQIVEEEAIEWKESLCYQLLRVTQDAYVTRGTVLRSVTKSYELN